MVTSKVGKRHAITGFEVLKELFISRLSLSLFVYSYLHVSKKKFIYQARCHIIIISLDFLVSIGLYELFLPIGVCWYFFNLMVLSLLPDRKLKELIQRPLNLLPKTKDGYSLLLFWYWEECLKQRYNVSAFWPAKEMHT